MKQPMRFDFLLLIVVLLLAVIGIAMVYSASNFKAKEQFGDSNFFLKRQLLRVFLGLLLMIIFFQIDYHNLQKVSGVILLFAILLLIYVLINGIEWKGSRRAFYIMSFVFQPSELARYALIAYLSWLIANKGDQIRDFTNGLLPVIIVVAITVTPIILEPDLGTAVIILIITAIMFFVSRANLLHLFALGIASLGTIAFALSNFSYQKHRLLSYLDAIRGVKEPTWQIMQSLICFTNGGLWGIGLGNSRQKLHFLPQPFTDFIYAIIGEEFGFIGAVMVLLLFLILLWRGVWIAIHAPDQHGRLLAIGITTSITIYAFTSVGIAINLLPVTGIPMPFISYGGSSLIMNFIAIGILLNISTQLKRKFSTTNLHLESMTSKLSYRKKKTKKRKRFVR